MFGRQEMGKGKFKKKHFLKLRSSLYWYIVGTLGLFTLLQESTVQLQYIICAHLNEMFLTCSSLILTQCVSTFYFRVKKFFYSEFCLLLFLKEIRPFVENKSYFLQHNIHLDR